MQRVRSYLMPMAIGLGIVFPEAHGLALWMPGLIGIMMFLSFVAPVTSAERGATRWVATRVVGGSVGLSLLLWVLGVGLNWPDYLVWAGFLLCLAPPANAAPAMARVLGGNPLLVLKLVVGGHGLACLLLPLLAAGYHGSLDAAGWGIASKVFVSVLVLVGTPILVAFLLKWRCPRGAASLAKASPYVIFLWSFMVFVVISNASHNISGLLAEGAFDWQGIVTVATLSMGVALALFGLGWRLGAGRYPVETSQGLGQKNTVLLIWVAQSYFHPVVALGPVFYVIWQNLILSWMARKRRVNPLR